MRARRLARGIRTAAKASARTAGGALAALAAVGFAALVHVGTPSGRRLVTRIANENLAELFHGKIVIDRIGGLGPEGLVGVDGRVLTEDGKPLVDARGIEARIDAWALLQKALFSEEPPLVRVDALAVDHVEISLADPRGFLAFRDAFVLKKPSSGPPGTSPTVQLRSIRVHHAWIHGFLAGELPVDAELTGLSGSLEKNSGGILIGLDDVSVKAREARPGAALTQRAHGALSVLRRGAPSLRVAAAGDLQGIPLSAEFALLEGQGLRASLDVPDASGEALAALVPELSLRGAVALHLDAEGALPGRGRNGHLWTTARGSITREGRRGELDSFADIRLGEQVKVTAGVNAKGLELAAFAAKTPPSRIGLSALARLSFQKGAPPVGVVHAWLGEGSQVASQPLPPTRATATLTPSRITADLTALEPGAPTRAHAELPRAGPLVFSTSTTVDLAALSRPGAVGRGAGTLTTSGTLDLATLSLDAHADAKVTGLDARVVRAGQVLVGVDAHGPLRAPSLHATLDAKNLGFGTSGKARAKGGLGLDTLTASAQIQLGNAVVVRDVLASAGTGAQAAQISVPEVRFGDGGLDVPSAGISGLGAEASASFSRHHQKTSAHLRSDDLDLDRVARLLGIWGLAGHLRVDAEATLTGLEAEGHARIHLLEGSLPGFERARASLEADLVGREARIKADAGLGGAFTLRARVDRMRLEGPALRPSSWLDAGGEGWVDAEGELASVFELAPARSLPFTVKSGRARFQASLDHGLAGGSPSVNVAVATQGLSLGPTPGKTGLTLAGIDAAAELRVDGTTGFTAISARLLDARGRLLSAEAKGRAPLAALLDAPRGDGGREAWRAWQDEPLQAHLALYRRSFSELPEFLGLTGLGGQGSFHATLEGTLKEPKVRLEAQALDLLAKGAGSPSTVTASVTYDGSAATLTAISTGRTGKVRVDGHIEARLAELLRGKPFEELAWTGDATASFEGFALATLPSSRDARLRGQLDGKIALVDLHRAARLTADLDATQVTVGGAPIPHISLRTSTGDDRGTASVRVDQSDGFAELRCDVGLAWGARLVPEFDRVRALDARLQARGFHLAALSPLTAQHLGDLDGRMDADAHVTADPTGKNVVSEGTIVARDVSFVLLALGQEYKKVGAKVTFLPGGVVKIDDVTASDGAGKLEASAVARFAGLDFSGARATVRVPKAFPFELVADGQALGDAHGELEISVEDDRQKGALSVVVGVPRLHVKLSDSAGHSVQALGAREDVHVGILKQGKLQRVELKRPKQAPSRPADGSGARSVELTVNLGRDVEVRRGQMLAVRLTGAPVFRVAGGKTQASGQIQLTGGTLDLQGKKFTIEKGILTFGAEVDNPVLLATASWTAGDPGKTRIVADFVGPVRTGKVTLRAEPTRTQSEILSLIVFGSTSGLTSATSTRGYTQGTGTQVAAAVGGGALTQGFDSAAFGLTGLDTQTRIDTTNAQNPRPEFEVQISRDVSLKFAYVLGTPPLSEPDKSLGTVIFRFAPSWSLSTTVGDKGKATADTTWQYRY